MTLEPILSTSWEDRLIQRSLLWLRWHKLMPTTRWGDRQYARLICLMYNGHWPRTYQGNTNDFIAFLKGSAEMGTPLRQKFTDKELAKDLIAQRLGPDWCVPTLAVLHNDREVDAWEFPQRCVIKPTHSSGQIVFRSAGEPVDRELLKKWLRFSHYRRSRERNYRNLERKIIVEPWLELQGGLEVSIHYLRGRTTNAWIWRNRTRLPEMQIYGLLREDGSMIGAGPGWSPDTQKVVSQEVGLKRFGQLFEATRRLCQGLLFARVDFHLTAQGDCVGEITTSLNSGVIRWSDPQAMRGAMQNLFGPNGFVLADYPELG